MPKNIILLSDGTGNGAAKLNKTNVWRLYDTLDLHRDDQIAFYDDGVGSQEFILLKLLGGAFGVGLKRNVRQLYKFLCRNYKTGDRIYLFGFSRGAFTVRLLAGMIAYCGVYTDFENEEELEKIAKDNYNAFRSNFKSGWLTQWIRRLIGRTAPKPTDDKPDIEFMGVWDTVDAYGLPMDWMAVAWDKLIYPIRFPDYQLSKKVKKACHALSVDDERETFHPLLWDERNEDSRIEQVWFPGVHSDVGGGYPKHNLSLVTLDWIISKVEAKPEAGTTGLYFIDQIRQEFLQQSDWNGAQHDSRSFLGAYYSYAPRDIHKLCTSYSNHWLINEPKIHRSVFERISANVIPYAPTGIPETYKIVSTRETSEPYETNDEKKMRIVKMRSALKVIKQRCILYYAFLIISLAFLVSPILCKDMNNSIGTITSFHTGLFKGVQFILPDFTAPWLNAWERTPLLFYTLVSLLIIFFVIKRMLHSRTQTLSTVAWHTLKRKKREQTESPTQVVHHLEVKKWKENISLS